jgi:hypothetical protein
MTRKVHMLLVLGASAWWLAAPAESGASPPAAPGASRVVVVPVNLAVRAAPEVEPGLEPVWRGLLAYFASREQRVIALDRADAGALWNEVMADAKRAGEEDLFATYARFARRVAEQAQFETIVFPTVVTRSARLSDRSASWDGVHRLVEIPGQFSESIETFREGKIWLDRHGASGELAAASLHVAVLSPAGELRFQGTGGLVLLQELILPPKPSDAEFAVVMRKDPFAAPDQLREGIEAAFR